MMTSWCRDVLAVMTVIVVIGIWTVSAQKPEHTEAGGDRRSLIVSSYLVAPYLMENTNLTDANTTDGNVTENTAAQGNEQYVGYIRDLLDALAEELDADYVIQLADGYGKEVGGKWTGMIGQVVREEANMTAGPITVTLAREQAVDFTYPFQRFEANIVMRKRHWNQEPHITSLEDLVNQDQVLYGVAKDGPVYNFLKESEAEIHKKMWEKMTSDTVVHFKEDNNKGVRRARTDNDYAFIMDGAAVGWVLGQEPCDLEAVEAGFYKRQYAFAVANQSPLRDEVNAAMVELEYSGVMEELYKKWLSPELCSGASRLGHVWGVVVTLVSTMLCLRLGLGPC